MATEFISTAASNIAGYLIPPCIRHVGYVLRTEQYVRNLQGGICKIGDERESIQHTIDDALRTEGSKIEPKVLTWCAKAEELEKDAEELVDSKKKAASAGCAGCVVNPKTRYNLGRKAKHALDDIRSHLAPEEKSFDRISYIPTQPEGIVTQAPSQGIVKLASRESMLDEIMKSLADDTVSRVGVYGDGGVGKTTFLSQVEERAQKHPKEYIKVVTVAVSRNPELPRIRGKINLAIDMVKTTSKNEDQQTNKKKVFLIILDDLWDKLNLADIGLMEMKDIPKDKIAMKLVMTSRNPDLLYDGMRCQPVFHLKKLEKGESLKLIASSMGEDILRDSDRKEKAEELTKKCDGLPLFINALSMELRDLSSPKDWDDALNKLKHSDSIQMALELNFQRLQERQFRLLSIVSSMDVTEGISHEVLLRYSVGLGRLESNTMGGCRIKVRELLDGLRASSLLLDSGNDCVKVHDLVRDNLAVRDQHDSVYRVEKHLEDCDVKICQSKGIFLPYPDIRELPCIWDCPELEILVLFVPEDRDCLLRVPCLLFTSMPQLKVMHFSHASLKPLPSSILRLNNLQTLCLEYCDLEDVSFVKEFKKLQVLSFKGSNIIKLSKEIGDLVHLRSLDLSHCTRLEVIESGSLEGLLQLEELYLEESFTQWSLGGLEGDDPPGNSSLSVLNKLPHLRNIDMLVPDVDMLQEDLPFFEKLDKYRVLVGDTWDWSEIKKGQRTLKVKLDGQCIMYTEWLQLTLQRTEDLQIQGSVGTKRSIQGLCIRGFNELKSLHVQNNHSVYSLVDSTGNAAAEAAFPMLESVFLENLSNLQSVWRGPSKTGRECFKSLEVLKVHNCLKLKSLLSVSLLGELKKLNEIEVIGCSMLQEIYIYESPREDDKKEKSTKDDKKKKSTKDEIVELQSLRRIKLRDLPNITRFLTIKDPNQPDRSHGSVAFFNGQVSLPSLESLEIHNLPKMTEIWKGHSSAYWSKLKSLKIKNCNNLVKAIDSSSILKLSGLKSLVIQDCEYMEEVFDARGMEVSAGGKVKILPSLRVMELKQLPRLRSLWDSTSSGLQNLESLDVWDCRELKYLFTSSMCKAMGNLKELRVSYCEKLESIVMVDNKHKWFPSSKVASTPSSNAENIIKLPSLRDLCIDSCDRMKSFAGSFRERKGPTVSDEEDISSVLFGSEVHLPSLEVLEIWGTTFKKIWHDKLHEESFCKLTSVYLFNCGHISVVFPSTMMERLNYLRSVGAELCESITTIFGHVLWDSEKRLQQINLLPELKELTLSGLKSLTHVVEKANSSRRGESVSVGFPSLTKLNIYECDELEYVFPSAIARTLSKLEEASIGYCGNMREVIVKEGEGESLDELTFPCLSSLQLYDLNSLISFSAMSCSFYFPYVEFLIIRYCKQMKTFVGTTTHSENPAIFNDKVELPKLVKLQIGKVGLTEFSNNQIPPWSLQSLKQLELADPSMSCYIDPSTSFAKKLMQQLETLHLRGRGNESLLRMLSHRLTSLELVGCDLTSLFTNSQVKWLSHLKHLKVEDCSSLRYIVDEEETGDTGSGVILFPSLTSLELRKLPKLCSFHKNCCASDDETGVKDTGIANDMENVHHQTQQSLFWVAQVSFPCMEKLVISHIDKIERIWHGQVAPESLPKLMELKIQDSENLQAVVMEDEMINDRELVFPRLTHIKLTNLLKLRSFHSGRRRTQFPLLRELTVDKAGAHVEFLASISDNSLAHLSLFLVDKASFPCLEIIEISNMESLRLILQSDVPGYSLLEQLRELKVEKCQAVETLFPADIVHTLRKLQKLEVESCSSLRVIYDISGPISTRQSDQNVKIGSQLKVLTLKSLPKLDHIIWNTTEPGRIVSFYNLTKIKVESCESLKYLFPPYVAKALYKLENLTIRNSGLEKIVLSSAEETDDVTQEFVFLRVANLELHGLTGLTCFYRGKHISRWPSLKYLVIHGCDTIQNLFRGVDWFRGTPDGVGTLFSVDKDSFLCLHDLSISCMDSLTTIWSSHGETNIHSFRNLESLSITSCSALKVVYEIEENVGSDGLPDSVRETPTQLKRLVLNDLAELQHIWSKDPRGVLSLHNLISVSVNGCKKLTYVFHASVVKALLQLVELNITDSDLEVIITDHGAQADGTQNFDFPHAAKMNLSNLPCLKGFYPGKHISWWPKLRELSISNCNAFDVFAFDLKKFQAVSKSSTPSNPAEQPLLLVDKKTFPNLETVKLENNNMKQIWGGLQHPKMTCFFMVRFHFADITTLEVVKCHSLISILTPSMVTELPGLATFKIKECDNLEAVIAAEKKAKKRTTIRLGSLQEVILHSLPKLASFYLHSSFIECPSLATLDISGCHEMKTFIASPHHKARTLKTVEEANTEDCRDNGDISIPPEPFFNEKILFPSLNKLAFSHMDSLKMIWHDQLLVERSFDKLKDVEIENCKELTRVFSAKTLERFRNLETLTISNCDILEVVFDVPKGRHDRVMTMSLKELSLSDLPWLRSLCGGDIDKIISFECPSLTTLGIRKCHQMKTFIASPHHKEIPLKSTGEANSEDLRDSGVISIPPEPFFNEKILFPGLKLLVFSHMDSLKMIWHDQLLAERSFDKLKEVEIEYCKELTRVFSAKTIERFINLENLTISNCNILEMVFDVPERRHNCVIRMALKNLTLRNLPELRSLCTGDIDGVISFEELRPVQCSRCRNLINFGRLTVERDDDDDDGHSL